MAAGSITWDLLMKTGSFVTDAKRAEKSLNDLKKQTDELKNSFKNVLGAIGIATGVHELTSQLRESVTTMDDFSKAAKRVGTTTEQFSALAYAAGLSDVSVEDLQGSMARLAKQASDGNKAFDAMGISVKDSSGNLKDTGELMTEVANKFGSYADGANKTAIAQELFGRSGAALIPLLNSGASGLADMRKEAEQFGLVVSTDAGQAAEDFNDQITRMSSLLSGSLMQAATELLPVAKQIADAIVDAGKKSKDATDSLDILKTGLRLAASAAIVVVTAFKALGTAIGADIAIFARFARAISDFSFNPKKQVENLQKTFKDVTLIQSEAMQDITAQLSGAGDMLAKIWQEPKQEVKKAAEESKKLTAAPMVASLTKAKAQTDELKKAIDALMKEGQALTQSLQTPGEQRQSAEGTARKLQVVGAIDDTTYQRALAKAQKDYDAAIDAEQQSLTDGLLTEEEAINASYERRRKQILALTEVTEADRQNALLSLQDKHDQDLSDAQYARYKDLMTAQETATRDYIDKKNQILDDDSLTNEQRIQYQTKLSEDYHKTMQELDAADQAKRDAVWQAQIQTVTDGFSQAAEIAKAFGGEQSSTYQALFAVSKSFALADIAIKQAQAIAAAWGENNYFTAIALTASLAAQFAGLISSVSGSNFGGTRAGGGPVVAGRSYNVGEQGTERFVPETNGRIVSNSDLQAQSPTVNVKNVNAYSTDHINDFLQTSAGEKAIVNVVKRNKRATGITS